MEIKHYKLYQGPDAGLLYTYVRVGNRDFYFHRQAWKKLKLKATLCLTFAIAFVTL